LEKAELIVGGGLLWSEDDEDVGEVEERRCFIIVNSEDRKGTRFHKRIMLTITRMAYSMFLILFISLFFS
jgi:soluble P-type ATPase